MDFEGCFNSIEREACKQLVNLSPIFIAHPQDSKIRLAISPPLTVPLNLTIHHGECNFSCEGGDLSSCPIFKTDRYWLDVSSSFYIENCTPLHYYCVTASIGECCPVCTQTIFMEDYKKEYYYEDQGQWMSAGLLIMSVLISVMFLISFVVILKNYFRGGSKYIRQKYPNSINDSLTQHILDIESNKPRITVVCLYLREHNMLFLDMINSIQEFLRRVGIYVIDIYNEEENINQSVKKWVQDVFSEENTKILLFDTATTHQLWNGTMDSGKMLKPLEQAICFAHDMCIPITNVHNHLFVVRFQGLDFNTKTFIDLSDGRCYMYPIHGERLANDLKS